MTATLAPDWLDQFQGLRSLPDDLKTSILSRAVPVSVGAGAQIFGPGHTPEYLLLLVSGRIRVQKVSEQGREIFLYRVVAGESCVMTTACLLAYEDYQAEGLAETDVLCAGLPRSYFDELLRELGHAVANLSWPRILALAFQCRQSADSKAAVLFGRA